ncbi:MAG: tetratricopeptide repeat protein [Smithella sp.]
MLSSETTQHKHLIPVLICLALAILTVIIFWQLKDCGFINFDDNAYIYENTYVQSGLNGSSIGQAFSSELVKIGGFWHPVTWLSLMLDYQIFGLNPSGYHLINLFFHVMNTVLLFLILHRMTKKLWPSAFVAALFAIHPLHVESVAWIAERKDVLSTFFWMLTMGAYSYYVEHPGLRRYFFVLLFFILGLMAKPMLVTLPFVLLLLDYWPLHRFQEIKQDHKVQAELFEKETVEVKKPADPEYKWSLIYPLLWEKVPLFVLAILSSILAYITVQKVGVVHSEAFPLSVRIGNAFVSYIAYIGKMIWPSNLAVFYPHPMLLLVPWRVLGSVFLLIAITLLVIWKAKQFPYLATGWLWYAGTLVPVIGIVQVGSFAMADRYTYIPLIGLFIIVAWGVPELLKRWKQRKEILLALGALIILGLSIKTWTQTGYWQNSITLYDHTLKVTDNNWLAYYNRGVTYDKLDNHRQAIEDFSRAIEIYPGFADPYYNRGIVYAGLGNYRQAMEDFSRVIEIKPSFARAYTNRGNAYQELGNYRQAMEDFSRVIEIKPGDADAYYNRGFTYEKLGQHQRAIEDFNETIRLKPDNAGAYCKRGIAHGIIGNNNLGCRDLQKACELGNCKLLEAANAKGLCR